MYPESRAGIEGQPLSQMYPITDVLARERLVADGIPSRWHAGFPSWPANPITAGSHQSVATDVTLSTTEGDGW